MPRCSVNIIVFSDCHDNEAAHELTVCDEMFNGYERLLDTRSDKASEES